jgi:hypothetical protein
VTEHELKAIKRLARNRSNAHRAAALKGAIVDLNHAMRSVWAFNELGAWDGLLSNLFEAQEQALRCLDDAIASVLSEDSDDIPF